MSRLIIKNLPAYVTPVRLREHIEQKGGPGGTITDVKVPLKANGASRHFGFVGFKTEKEASAAQAWFNNTFVDSARISVAIIEGSKDAPPARPNKRPRLGPSPIDSSSATVNTSMKSKMSVEALPERTPQLEQFLQVMKPAQKNGPSWANDQKVTPNQPPLTNRKPTKMATPDETAATADRETNEKDENISDLDWMRRHMSKTVDGEQAVESLIEPSTTTSDSTIDTILQTSRLFLRNLAFSCSDADLLELFKPFGEISQVHIPLDPLSKQSKGLAYVTFTEPSCAVAAYEALDKKSFQGRLLHILAAVDRKNKFVVEEGEGKKRKLKDEKHLKRKAAAGQDFNWSMLYMNSDAVLSSISDRMNISKADILDPESDNAAVKLALAETHVIQETKTYLESQGVVLSAFSSSRGARSDTAILVKNIPYGTTAEQIREMFEQHGKLSRVLVPPAGTMALVEFIHADEASAAFRAIAYRRLGNSVVYLEKGPLGIFKDESGAPARLAVSTAFKPVTIAEQQRAGEGGEDEEAETPAGAGSTLFVKNLSFATTSERLAQVFRHLPSFAFARVQMKPNADSGASTSTSASASAARLSMGYGFVGFKTREAARKAMKGMQRYVLDGHALHVDFAGRGADADADGGVGVVGPGAAGGGGGGGRKKKKTTKMIVKNVPFEATKKDIRALFGAYGTLRSVRVPKTFDTRSRGFAFLDFATRQEAENALAMLRHTHLLGRHLVLEWASTPGDEGDGDGDGVVEALRRKAGVGLGAGREMPGRRKKLDLGLGEGGGGGGGGGGDGDGDDDDL